jgi:DnaJ-class molecular chaperone
VSRYLILDTEQTCATCEGRKTVFSAMGLNFVACVECAGTGARYVSLEEALANIEAEQQRQRDEHAAQYGHPPGGLLL